MATAVRFPCRDRWWRLIAAALATAALAVLSMTAPRAQQVGEDEVRAMLDEFYRTAFAGPVSVGAFKLAGPVVVRAVGAPSSSTLFEVLLPGIEAADTEGRRVELGDLRLRIEALGEDRFTISSNLPKSITLRDAEGTVMGRARIGRHEFKGTWNAGLLQLEKADWQSGIWRVSDASGAQVLTMASAKFVASLTQTSPARGDSVAELELRDISISAGGGMDLVQINRLTARGESKRTDLRGSARLLRDLAARPEVDPTDPAILSELSKVIFSSFELLGDVDYFFELEGLFGRFGRFGQNVERFSVDSVEFGFGLEGLDGDAGTIRLRYGHRGVELPLDDAPPGVVPHSVGLRLSLQNIPFAAMFELVADYFEQTFQEEPDPAAGLVLSGRLTGLLMEAESLLGIDEIALESDIASLDGRGSIRPDPSGRSPATGSGTITIRGLERLQRELLSEISRDTLGYIAIIGILVALGEEVEDERGRAFVYNLEVSPDGKLLINGEDFAPLLEEFNSSEGGAEVGD